MGAVMHLFRFHLLMHLVLVSFAALFVWNSFIEKRLNPQLTTVEGCECTTLVATNGEAATTGEVMMTLRFGRPSTRAPTSNTRHAIEMMVFMVFVERV